MVRCIARCRYLVTSRCQVSSLHSDDLDQSFVELPSQSSASLLSDHYQGLKEINISCDLDVSIGLENTNFDRFGGNGL